MSDKAETAAIRLWRDRAHLREQERDEAQARARIAEEKVAILTAENDRLADEVARLRALLTPDAAQARAEIGPGQSEKLLVGIESRAMLGGETPSDRGRFHRAEQKTRERQRESSFKSCQ